MAVFLTTKFCCSNHLCIWAQVKSRAGLEIWRGKSEEFRSRGAAPRTGEMVEKAVEWLRFMELYDALWMLTYAN